MKTLKISFGIMIMKVLSIYKKTIQMNRYEQIMYERDLPGIRISLESISKTLKEIEKLVKYQVIISDPGDEVEHIEMDSTKDEPLEMD